MKFPEWDRNFIHNERPFRRLLQVPPGIPGWGCVHAPGFFDLRKWCESVDAARDRVRREAIGLFKEDFKKFFPVFNNP